MKIREKNELSRFPAKELEPNPRKSSGRTDYVKKARGWHFLPPRPSPAKAIAVRYRPIILRMAGPETGDRAVVYTSLHGCRFDMNRFDMKLIRHVSDLPTRLLPDHGARRGSARTTNRT